MVITLTASHSVHSRESKRYIHPCTRPELDWGSYSPSQTQWDIFSLYPTGAPLSYLQEVMHLGHSDIMQNPVLLLSQKSPAFLSPDQLKGIIDP